MKKLISGCCLGLLLLGSCLGNLSYAGAANEPVNEEELFSGGATVEAKTQTNENVDEELTKQFFGYSGEFEIDSTYSDDELKNTLSTDLFLDARFKGGVKSFLDLGWVVYPEGTATSLVSTKKTYHDLIVKEFFLDANWKNQVYFRFGKQVLKWGRGYFWNPSDLISVEKKNFFDLNKNREGIEGVKVHIPSGVKQNVYFFVGMNDVDSLEDVSLAGKYEWLVGNSEMAFSAWVKDGMSPVFSYDCSTRSGKVDWRGEVSLHDGNDTQKLENQGGTYAWNTVDGWYAKACVGFTRYFDLGAVKDRISLTGECFYNGAGYSENIYQSFKTRDRNNLETQQLLQNFYTNYQSFYNSRYYLALFGNVNKFLMSELTLKVNSIANLVDNSVCLITGVTYKPTIKNWSVEFDVYNYLGDEASEAKLQGDSQTLYLAVTIPF